MRKRSNANAADPGTNSVSQSRPQRVTITAPNFQVASFEIAGDLLVIHRMSSKLKGEMLAKQEEGKSASSKRKRQPKSSDDTYEQARYRSPEGWDGFQASAIRNAMISACRLTDMKMTLAKLSCFILADGNDAEEPQIPLIRIIGKPVKQMDMARVATGEPYVTVRACYRNWKARVRIRWDADQFSISDITNLLHRVGEQVGIGEGRPDSKKSAGMGWGTFKVGERIDRSLPEAA